MTANLSLIINTSFDHLWTPPRPFLSSDGYGLPCDQSEYQRLAFQHHTFKTALGGLYMAPLTQPRRILDLGCGPGFWAADMCRLFPKATVVGLDTNPTQQPFRPFNYHFVHGSLLNPLPFANSSFDYVHQRFLFGAIPSHLWPQVMVEIARVTAPGGWVELLEGLPGIENLGPASSIFMDRYHTADRKQKHDLFQMFHLADFLHATGITSVSQRIIWLPLGMKQGRVGFLLQLNLGRLFASLACYVLQSTPGDSACYHKEWLAMMYEWAQISARIPFVLTIGQK